MSDFLVFCNFVNLFSRFRFRYFLKLSVSNLRSYFCFFYNAYCLASLMLTFIAVLLFTDELDYIIPNNLDLKLNVSA